MRSRCGPLAAEERSCVDLSGSLYFARRRRGGRVAECTALLRRRTGFPVPGVRIPPSPPETKKAPLGPFLCPGWTVSSGSKDGIEQDMSRLDGIQRFLHITHHTTIRWSGLKKAAISLDKLINLRVRPKVRPRCRWQGSDPCVSARCLTYGLTPLSNYKHNLYNNPRSAKLID